MTSVLFISIYDEYCLGVRQLVANLRHSGHQAYLLCLKHYGKFDLKNDDIPETEWQIIIKPDGSRSALSYPYPITPCEKELLQNLLNKLKPRVIGLTVNSINIKTTIQVTRWLREMSPNSVLLWGGPHATLNPSSSAQYADFICVSEGDICINDFCNAIDKGTDLTAIPSMAFRGKDGSVVQNPLSSLIHNLDTLPYAYHGKEEVFYIDFDTITEGVPFSDSELLHSHKIMTSRGCPYTCSYCMLSHQKDIIPESRKLRYRSIGNVIGELEEVKRRMGHYYLEIEDDIFTLNYKRMVEFFEAYSQRIAMPFWCYTHPNFVTEKALSLLKKNNIQYIIMGIEAGSDHIANDIFRRKVKKERLISSTQLIHNSGIRCFYDVISNNPFETEEDRIENFHVIRRIPKPFEFQIVALNIFPNTKIDIMRREAGLPRTVDFQQYRYWNALYHLASVINIDDHLSDILLNYPPFRQKPEILENLSGQIAQIAHNLGDAELWNLIYKNEIDKQVKKNELLQKQIDEITHRRGYKLFITISNILRKIKRIFRK